MLVSETFDQQGSIQGFFLGLGDYHYDAQFLLYPDMVSRHFFLILGFPTKKNFSMMNSNTSLLTALNNSVRRLSFKTCEAQNLKNTILQDTRVY